MRGREFARLLAGMQKRPLGAEPPVPAWERELDRARAEYRAHYPLFVAEPAAIPPAPVAAKPAILTSVLLGHHLAEFRERSDGRILMKWCSRDETGAYFERWALAEGYKKEIDPEFAARGRLN